MMHLRIVAPAELAADVLAYLDGLDVAVGLVHLPGVARRPRGDLLLCDVPREAGSEVMSRLRQLGVAATGTIAIAPIEAAVSELAAQAQACAPGAGSDAVVWEALEIRTASTAEGSVSFLTYMMVATLLAAVAIMTDSVVLLIGAMVVGPEFGPLAGVCVGATQRRPELAWRSARALAIGFPLGILAAYLATVGLLAAGVAPPVLTAQIHPATMFISRPDTFAVITAALAGIAGMLSLTTSNSSVLIGVLISVTTIPAAGNISVAAAYGNRTELVGSIAQLGLNVAVLLVVGVATLLLQRFAFVRRLAGRVRQLTRLGGSPRRR